MSNSLNQLRQSAAALQTGNLAEALRLAQAILRAEPDNFDAHHIVALACYHARDLARAQYHIDRALAIRSDMPDAFNTHGLILRAMNRVPDAAQQFSRAVKLNPLSREAHYNLANSCQDLGRLPAALEHYDAALRIEPGMVMAWNNRGLALRRMGRPQEALGSFDEAVRRAADFAPAHYNRGDCLAALKRLDDAVASYDRALALKPDFAEAHCNRGNALMELGRNAEALAGYDRALALAPRFHQAHLSRGIALVAANRQAEAEESFRKAISLRPDYADAHYNLGKLLDARGRSEKALASYDEAIRLRPDHAESHNNRGNVLRDLNRFDEALVSYDRAISLKPDMVDTHTNRGKALMEMGRPVEAMKSFERSLALRPGYVDARLGLAKLAAEEGRFAEAETLFEAVLQDAPGNVGSLHGLSGVRKFKAGDPLFAAIAERLRDATLTPEQREQLHHGYAKICNDAGRHDEAMAHFALSKACRPSRFDLARHRAAFAAMQELFTPAFFAARAGFGSDDPRPVFVVGMPRSGTTLTEQIIAAHPAVRGFGERQDLADLSKTLAGGLRKPQGFADAVAALDAAGAADLARRYGATWRGADPALRRLVDKRPHNYELLGLVALMFPNAHIIHCRRNAMDNCLSMYMQDFNVNHGYNRDLTTLGQYYRAYEELMAHWRKVLPLPIHDCVYEDTVDDLETSARGLIAFLGLDWDPACLDYHRQERQVRTPSQWQVRQPVYRSSVEAWRRYEGDLGPLKAALGIT